MIVLMMLAAAVASIPPQRFTCDLTTAFEGKNKRVTRLVVLAQNSWQEAERGQRLSELCSRPGIDGYRCALNAKLFTATSQAAGPESSTVRIDLRVGSYSDRGYMDGKSIVTWGTCKRF
jgi:hypothetical protein